MTNPFTLHILGIGCSKIEWMDPMRIAFMCLVHVAEEIAKIKTPRFASIKILYECHDFKIEDILNKIDWTKLTRLTDEEMKKSEDDQNTERAKHAKCPYVLQVVEKKFDKYVMTPCFVASAPLQQLEYSYNFTILKIPCALNRHCDE